MQTHQTINNTDGYSPSKTTALANRPITNICNFRSSSDCYLNLLLNVFVKLNQNIFGNTAILSNFMQFVQEYFSLNTHVKYFYDFVSCAVNAGAIHNLI